MHTVALLAASHPDKIRPTPLGLVSSDRAECCYGTSFENDFWPLSLVVGCRGSKDVRLMNLSKVSRKATDASVRRRPIALPNRAGFDSTSNVAGQAEPSFLQFGLVC